MRSRTSFNISSDSVHQWALQWLLQAELITAGGRKCTPEVTLNILLRAAARCISIYAACFDLEGGPSGQAVMNCLEASLPSSAAALEERLNPILTGDMPRWMLRRKWEIAIDLHLVPYYGQPFQHRYELYTGPSRKGTQRFHAYATACIVVHGMRYTVALTSVRRRETMADILRRLMAIIRKIGLKTRCFLLDRGFFSIGVVELLQAEGIPFLMPVVIRGRRPKKGRKVTGLRWINRQAAGWYRHTMKNAKRQATMKVCVGYRRHKNRKDGKQVSQKLLFAAWGIRGSPTDIRERYRKRFGIETSYRQLNQARIYTCTRNPILRLLFVAIALILRNFWVWLHQTKFAEGSRTDPEIHLERMRLKRLLDWLVHEITRFFEKNAKPTAQMNL